MNQPNYGPRPPLTTSTTIFRDLDFEEDGDPNALQDALLRALERNDMDGTPRKEQLFLRDDDSDDEDEDAEEDEHEEAPRAKKTPKETRPAKKARRGTTDVKDVRAAAKTWKASAAMKALLLRIALAHLQPTEPSAQENITGTGLRGPR
ncbi:hypothetical protein C8R46DRAFT_1041842 [Mycena filopes]|nr:hypothetical protein C8R46DRAFT_1041842 [Mycena filopes]